MAQPTVLTRSSASEARVWKKTEEAGARNAVFHLHWIPASLTFNERATRGNKGSL